MSAYAMAAGEIPAKRIPSFDSNDLIANIPTPQMSAAVATDRPGTSLPPSSVIRVKNVYKKLLWFNIFEKQLGAPPTAQDVSDLVTIVQGLSPLINWEAPKILPHLEEDTIQEWISTVVATKEPIYLWEYYCAKEFLGAMRRFNLEVRPQTTILDIILAKRSLVFEKASIPGYLFKKIDPAKGLVVFWLLPNTTDVLREVVAGMEKKVGGQLDAARVRSILETRVEMNNLAEPVERAQAARRLLRAVGGRQSSPRNTSNSSAWRSTPSLSLNMAYPLVNPDRLLYQAFLGDCAEKLRNELPDAATMRDLCNTVVMIEDAVMETRRAKTYRGPRFEKEKVRFSPLLDQITHPNGLSGPLSKREREALASLPCRFNPQHSVQTSPTNATQFLWSNTVVHMKDTITRDCLFLFLKFSQTHPSSNCRRVDRRSN